MTLSNKDKKLLVYLIAVGIVALVYFFVARPNLDKQQQLANESDNLRMQVNHYNDIYNNLENYENKVAETQTEYSETLNKFFVGLNQENTLINIKDMEEATNTWISRISFQESQIVMGSGGENAATEGEEPIEGEDLTVSSSGLTGMKEDLNLEYSCSYSDFKRFIEYIQNYDQRLFITSINASYSPDANKVQGTLVLSQYAILGTDKENVAPELSGIGVGVDNIFSTLKGVPQNEESTLTVETIEDTDGENADTEENTSDEEVSQENSSEEDSVGHEETPQPAPAGNKPPQGGGVI